MNLSIRLAVGSLVTVICLASVRAQAPKKLTGPEAETAAKKWLGGLGDRGLTLAPKVVQGGFRASQGNSAVGPITRVEFEQDGWWVTLAFRGRHSAQTPLKTLQADLWHAVLERVPTPGLDLPGWDVRLRTPTSSFDKGIEILSFQDGKLKVRVKTSFFALYGRDASIRVPADAPSPPGSYFTIRQPVPIDLTLEAPIKFP